MSMGLTPRMRDALVFIRGHIAAHDVPPSYDEIKRGLSLRSRGGVARLVDSLQQRGYITRKPGFMRSLALTEQPSRTYTLPPTVQLELDRFCARTQQRAADVIADAVTLFIDQDRDA